MWEKTVTKKKKNQSKADAPPVTEKPERGDRPERGDGERNTGGGGGGGRGGRRDRGIPRFQKGEFRFFCETAK